jgi:cytochrome c oxidase assembly protein subunit 15
MLYLSFQIFPKHHPVRALSIITFALTLTEGLLGAALVKAGLVADNSSVMRAYVMVLHLVNSLLLVAALVMSYDWSLEDHSPKTRFIKKNKSTLYMILFFLFVACTGGIASLSTTLFPSESLISGLLDDFSKDSHFLVKLRISHPLLATIIGGVLILWSFRMSQNVKDPGLLSRLKLFSKFVMLGILIGYMTLFLLSPVLLKFVHLSWAYFLWILLILILSGFLKEKNQA